ncbi:MAG: hypothetical protein R3Y32_03630 [Bacillota bacterium]
MSTDTSYSSSFHTANPYEAYPSSVFDSDEKETTTTETTETASDYVTLAVRSTSSYLEELEAQAEAQAAAILEQYEIAKASAYEDMNNSISLSQQEYLKNTNPYGVLSENLSSYGFDSTGGYSVSNAQSSYANYINSQNSANSAYSDAVTDLAVSAIDSQLENSYFYTDITADLMGDMQSIYSQLVSSSDSSSSEYQENILSALEFVETLYNVSPTKVTADNADLQAYIEKIYGVTGDDYTFIVDSVLNLLGSYGFVENDFWNQFE